MKSLILIVDDDAPLRMRLQRAFTERGFRAIEAADAHEAESLIVNHRIDRAVIDLRMPGTSGLQLLETFRRLSPDTAVVMLSGYGSIVLADEKGLLASSSALTSRCTECMPWRLARP